MHATIFRVRFAKYLKTILQLMNESLHLVGLSRKSL